MKPIHSLCGQLPRSWDFNLIFKATVEPGLEPRLNPPARDFTRILPVPGRCPRHVKRRERRESLWLGAASVGGPAFAPTDPSLPSLPQGAPVGRPLSLRSWPGERGDSPRWVAALSRELWWVCGPAWRGRLSGAGGQRGTPGSGQQGNSDTYWPRGHGIGAVGAALGWGCPAALDLGGHKNLHPRLGLPL